MHNKFYTIKSKLGAKSNLLNSYLPFKIKAKILLPTLAIAAVAVPTAIFGITKLIGANSNASGLNGCTPQVVLGENQNLNFVCDNNTYIPGQTYTDNKGSTVIKARYDLPEPGQRPRWESSRDIIATANFHDTFANFYPISTAEWFAGQENLSTVTNTKNLHTDDVTDMRGMFANAGSKATSFKLDVSSWKTSNVTNMEGMFAESGGENTHEWLITGLNSWKTGETTNMSYMFANAGKYTPMINLDLSSWDTSKVTNMSHMFDRAGSEVTTFIMNLSNWKTGNVTNMDSMFNWTASDAYTFKLDLSNWDTSKVTNMQNLFFNAGRDAVTWSIGDLSKWNTSKVTNMGYMFCGAGRNNSSWSVGDLSNWDTSNVTSMYHMFAGVASGVTSPIILNLSNWNTSKVTDMRYMFANSKIKTIIVGSGWNTDKVPASKSDEDDGDWHMFEGATALVGGNGTTYNASHINKEYARIDNSSHKGYLTGATYSVTLNNQSATSAGTTKIYEQYGIGFFLDTAKTKKMSTSANPITKPARSATVSYNMGKTGIPTPASEKVSLGFGGYYTSAGGKGTQYINDNGYLTTSAAIDHFKNASGSLYAKWNGASVELPTIDKEGYSCQWAQGSESGQQYAGGATVSDIAGDTKFYAVCVVQDNPAPAPTPGSETAGGGANGSSGASVPNTGSSRDSNGFTIAAFILTPIIAVGATLAFVVRRHKRSHIKFD